MSRLTAARPRGRAAATHLQPERHWTTVNDPMLAFEIVHFLVEVGQILAALLVAALVVWAGVAVVEADWWPFSRTPTYDLEQRGPSLAYPYYVDANGLRTLAAAAKVQLPQGRQVTRERRFGGGMKVISAEGARTETAQFGEEIDLNGFADALEENLEWDRLARGLDHAPSVPARDVLEEVIRTIDMTLGETSQVREALSQVARLFDEEQSSTIARQKREQLEEAAAHSKLLVLTSRFARAGSEQGMTTLQMTHLEPVPVYELEGDRLQPRRGVAPATEMPPGVGITVRLPNDGALTDYGRERFSRAQPFFGRVIAHSPSFDTTTGVLTCAAYAVWGTSQEGPENYPGHV